MPFQNSQNELPGVFRGPAVGAGHFPLRPRDTVCLRSDSPFESGPSPLRQGIVLFYWSFHLSDLWNQEDPLYKGDEEVFPGKYQKYFPGSGSRGACRDNLAFADPGLLT